VKDWNTGRADNKPFLSLSGGNTAATAKLTLLMYLGKNTNKLGVRVTTESTRTGGNNVILNDVLAGTGIYTDDAINFKKCDIEQVDLQKWVNITTVLSGRTLDIYIDGKLSRSCLLEGLFMVDGDVPTLKLGHKDKGFGGIIGMTRAANFAYSPDRIYNYYQQGPFSSFSLSSLNPGEYSFDLKRNGASVFSASG
jgi:hypothetical protein